MSILFSVDSVSLSSLATIFDDSVVFSGLEGDGVNAGIIDLILSSVPSFSCKRHNSL